MSAIVLDYPNSIPTRHSIKIRSLILLIANVALIAFVFLVAASIFEKMDLTFGAVVIPVPVVPSLVAQIQPAVTVTTTPNPVVIAVPVATPPSLSM